MSVCVCVCVCEGCICEYWPMKIKYTCIDLNSYATVNMVKHVDYLWKEWNIWDFWTSCSEVKTGSVSRFRFLEDKLGEVSSVLLWILMSLLHNEDKSGLSRSYLS